MEQGGSSLDDEVAVLEREEEVVKKHAEQSEIETFLDKKNVIEGWSSQRPR